MECRTAATATCLARRQVWLLPAAAIARLALQVHAYCRATAVRPPHTSGAILTEPAAILRDLSNPAACEAHSARHARPATVHTSHLDRSVVGY